MLCFYHLTSFNYSRNKGNNKLLNGVKIKTLQTWHNWTRKKVWTRELLDHRGKERKDFSQRGYRKNRLERENIGWRRGKNLWFIHLCMYFTSPPWANSTCPPTRLEECSPEAQWFHTTADHTLQWGHQYIILWPINRTKHVIVLMPLCQVNTRPLKPFPTDWCGYQTIKPESHRPIRPSKSNLPIMSSKQSHTKPLGHQTTFSLTKVTHAASSRSSTGPIRSSWHIQQIQEAITATCARAVRPSGHRGILPQAHQAISHANLPSPAGRALWCQGII